MKALLSSLLMITVLCGPALAQAPPRPAAQTLEVTMVVDTGSAPRRYHMKLIDGTCGNISSKTAGKLEDSFEDAIELCATDGAQIELMIDWMTRDGLREFRFNSTVAVERGGTISIDGSGATLALSVN